MTNARVLLCLALGSTLAACGGESDSGTNEDEGSLASTTLVYRGASLAGAEFGVDPNGNGPLPGTFGVNYTYPDSAYVASYTSPDYYLAKGMTTFRLPFRWERLQPARNAAFSAAELARLTTTVSHLTGKGATVLLDPHNYARYGTSLIGSPAVPNADFADFWSRLATTFKGNPKVLFGLMNEPHDMPTEQWVSAANAAIAAIRQAGATNLILVPGNGWTGAESWAQNWYGTPNSTALLAIQDPGNNYAFEAHQYLDTSGGSNQACVSPTIGSQRLSGFTSWLRANGKKGFIGELGAGSSATCLSAIDDMLNHVEANSDVYLGWTYWAGGPWWGNNWMAVEPAAGADVPQMTTLLPHLAAAPPPPQATCSDGIKNGTETGVDCGGSCAACAASCQGTSYDAATMFHSLGVAVAGGWSLWGNGYTQTSHNVVAGQSTITVTASGSVAAGVWAHMVVSVDGTPVGNTFVTGSWADYVFPLAVPAGSHQIRVAFDNDFASQSEDRNLFVAKVVVGCGAQAPSPTCSDGIKNGAETGVDCGGSCAACQAPACAPATFAAASMTHSLGAAATGGWNLWSNGYAATNNTFVAGSTTITVSAKGSVGAGVWPHMVVSVGGVVIGTASVQSASFTPYPFTFTATAGSQEIRVAFDNDYASQTEDRNLYLASVAVSCGGAQAPAAQAPAAQAPAQQPPAQIPAGSPIRIMPLGDSITLGVNGGYRNGLWTRLTAAGKSANFVGSQIDQYTKAPDHDHEGHPGFTIGNIAASADGWLQSAAPSVVLLMIGTNDLAWWCAETASQVADRNALLVDQILADLPNAWVVVGSIPPMASSLIQPNNVDRAQLAVSYNAAIKSRVQTRIAAGKHVLFADVNAVLTVSDLYDGIHPTEAAADKVAQVWYDAMTPILP